MDNLSAAEVLQQYGYDPNVILTSEGKLVLPDGGDAEPTSSDKSDDSSSSDDDLSNSLGKELPSSGRRQRLKVKLKEKIRQRAQARERGATPAFKKRDFNFVKCGMVKEWLVDTGCGYDLVSQNEIGLIKRFVSKAKVPITFHTANGPTRTENIASIHVRELDENITPYVLDNTPPVLTVGSRCMEMGYTFVWPTSQDPYFIRPDGMIIRLMVENYIPYLVPNARHCKPRKPSGTRIFCSPSTSTITNARSGAPDRRDLNSPEPSVATPSDSDMSEEDNISRLDDFEAPAPDSEGHEEEQSSSGDEKGNK
jgi:hypothetical protein